MRQSRQKVLLDLAVPLNKDVLSKLATKVTSSVLDQFERKKRCCKNRTKIHFIHFKLRYGQYYQNRRVNFN